MNPIPRPVLPVAALGLCLLAAPPHAAGGLPADPCAIAGRLVQNGGRTFVEERGTLREVDLTTFCLSCHDGAVGPPVACPGSGRRADPLSTLGPPAGTAHGMSPHFVDQEYPARASGLRAASEVGGRVHLVDGRVTCLTCHSSTRPSTSYMEPPEEPFGLCICCHFR